MVLTGPRSFNFDWMGRGTSLLRRACQEITTRETFRADMFTDEHYPIYFRVEEKASPVGSDPTIQVVYSNTSIAFGEGTPPAASPAFTRPVALLGLMLLAALQPTGRILGRKASTPWVIRCFPILYVADALATLVSWVHLALVGGFGIRQAASSVFQARNTGEDMEHWSFALTKAKAATPTRWAAFWFGVGLPLMDTFLEASAQAKVLLSVYTVAWLVFEALLLAADVDADQDKTDSDESTAPKTDSDEPAAPIASSGSDSPVLVESPLPHRTASAEEQEETATQLPVPVEPQPELSTPEGDHPTSPATQESSPIMRYFSTAAIIVSAIYHVAPFIFSEAAKWYAGLAGWYLSWYLSAPVDGPTDAERFGRFQDWLLSHPLGRLGSSSLLQAAEVVLKPIFWLGIAAQDLYFGEWLSTLGYPDDDEESQESLFMKWPLLTGIAFGAVDFVYRVFWEDPNSQDHGGVEWIATAVVGFILLQRFGGGKGIVSMGVVDLFRVNVAFAAVTFYLQSGGDGTPPEPRGWICHLGGLCSLFS